ncbi:potassium-transporting ATPase subunit A [Janibacter sp. HTCC2649]|nr:potassium-transporting ATPase subunit A [Janibacter sp. HTCC2649]
MPVKAIDAICTRRRQEVVNTCQGVVKDRAPVVDESLTADVIENLIGAIAGIAVLAYLVYALIRPDKF